MAALKKPIEAFDFAKDFLKSMPLEKVQPAILDDINKMIWMAAPWRWTLGVCSPVTVTKDLADFSLVDPPTDFLYIVRAYIWDGETMIPLSAESSLPSDTTTKGTPNKIAYISGVTPKFRLHPVMGSVNASKSYKLIVWYKKSAPVITKANMNTSGVLVMDDEWFHVYRAGVTWLAYLFGDDERSGSANAATNGQVQFSGMRAIFESGLIQMRMSEPLVSQNFVGMPDPKKDRG